MIEVYFPIIIDNEREIYRWLKEYKDEVRMTGPATIEFDDDELAILFKLKFKL